MGPLSSCDGQWAAFSSLCAIEEGHQLLLPRVWNTQVGDVPDTCIAKQFWESFTCSRLREQVILTVLWTLCIQDDLWACQHVLHWAQGISWEHKGSVGLNLDPTLTETMFKNLKEIMRTRSCQWENINREIETVHIKSTNWNWKVQ